MWVIKTRGARLIWYILVIGSLCSLASGVGIAGDSPTLAKAARSLKNDVSAPLRSLKPLPPVSGELRVIPLGALPRVNGSIGDDGGSPPEVDTLREKTPGRNMYSKSAGTGSPKVIDQSLERVLPKARIITTGVNFEGINNVYDFLPPDTNGDVGPSHYVQIVNRAFEIFDKTGASLYGPAANNILWSGLGGICETHNDGDPIVLYDELADRWLVSECARNSSNDCHQCIAVSVTGDPTGSWYRYEFDMPDTKVYEDPKFGVWPDGYYMAINQFDGSTGAWAGQGVVVFERDKMLQGAPALVMYFEYPDPNVRGMLPSDLDGPPPPAGTPNFYVRFNDDAWGFPQDQLEIWEFHVDWTTPANSNFYKMQTLPTAPFDSDMCAFATSCIPQPGTMQGVDALSDRLMYRLQYRNFGPYQTMVVNHTVDVDGTAGIRWYELRNSGTGWAIRQQGTYAPDGDHRWMGSIAMNGQGDIALGYSVSGGDTYPSIRYVGRRASDPLGTLPLGEMILIAGSGSQTHSSGLWGAYSMMSVDPVDDRTFWYTQEYYATTSPAGWQTRIGSFQFEFGANAMPWLPLLLYGD